MVFWDGLWDAVVDTAGLVPFLLATYLVMEAIEHAGLGASQRVISKAGAAGPVAGALLGIVPQCGFSAMAATLYSVRVVTFGTLIAVMLSTSDEMLPVFVAQAAPPSLIGEILAVKVVVALIAGFLVDLAIRVWRGPQSLSPIIHELCERERCHCSEDAARCEACRECAEGEGPCDPSHLDAHGHADADGDAHAHAHGHDHGGSTLKVIVTSALIHTVKVTIFIFLVTWGIDLVLDAVGHDVIALFFAQNPVSSVFVAALVGLIPNCGASVVISELFLEGTLGSGALIAGLLSGAGVSILVLFRANRHAGENLACLAILFGVGSLAGLLVGASGFVFA